jgi:integrase
MSSDAWTFQRAEQVRDMGEDKAPWYVGWYDPDGRRQARSCGPGFHGKKKAEKLKRQIEAELLTGTYRMDSRRLWADFRAEYREKILPRLAARSRPEVETSLAHFERIVKPVRVFAIDTQHVDEFTAARRQEKGKKRGSVVAPATVNKDLRHIKAALAVAVEWGYLKQLPRFRMEREPKRLAIYVTGEHFAAIYAACETARMPEDLQGATAADWWRGLIVLGYWTGWRIGDILGLRREDLDLEGGYAVTRFEDNKGKRDDKVKLHPVILVHLAALGGFTPTVFPWNHNRRTLDSEFHRIQRAAGIHLPCPDRHEHTDACHAYGFHGLRRAFATLNADRLSADALQKLMRHKSYATTQGYINMARQMDEAVNSLAVPEVLKGKVAGL